MAVASRSRPHRALRWLVLAMLVDTLGSGLVVPFELLFGTELVGLTLVETGIALSIGTGLAIAAGPIAGSIVDRAGPVRVVVAANAMAIAGCLGLLVADGIPSFIAVTFILAAAARSFWAAYAPLTAQFVEAADLETWFGRFRAARYAGIAAGAAIASFALLAGRDTGLRIVLLLDAVSYLAAIGLYLAAARLDTRRPIAPRATTTQEPGDGGGGYRTALRDHANVVTAALNVVCTLVITMPFLALPIFALDRIGLAVWVPGALAALATMAVAVPTFFAGRIGRGRRRLELLTVSAALWSIGSLLIAGVASSPAIPLLALPVGTVVLGVGEAIYAPTADALPLALAPAGLQGRYSAVHQLAWGISGTLAPVLTAWLLVVGSGTLWLVLAATAALLAVAYLGLERGIGPRAGVSGGTVGSSDA